MSPEDELTPATINMIASDVRDGKPHKEDIDRVLAYFCKLVDEGRPLPFELRLYLRDSFKKYLDEGATSIDQGLGLVRGKVGRGPADDYRDMDIAAAVLEKRGIDGRSHQDALDEVAVDFKVKKTKVGEAFRKYRGAAKAVLFAQRLILDLPPWTADQSRKINKICKGSEKTAQEVLASEPPTITPKN